jgi:HPt (histidine-containing phosphotransfer) domain-containing protein
MPTSNAPHPQKDPEATRLLLAELWERNLPLIRDRCAQLEEALAATRANTLTSQMREEAIATAHKLAGSLGMFGYPEGTEHARRIEQQLESEIPLDPQRLSENVAALCNALPL